MQFTRLAFFCGLLASASAHFQLQYPAPRGPFVEDAEPGFCDGYTNAVANRSTFPLGQGGFISINSEHPKWALGGIIATVQNPSSFNDFRGGSNDFQQFMPFFGTTGEGHFCVHVDLNSTGISGIKDGANVTLQFVFDGGDGQLYQCADLTLSSNFTIPSSVECANATANAVATPVSTSVSPGSTETGTSAATGGPIAGMQVLGAAGVAALVGAAVMLV